MIALVIAPSVFPLDCSTCAVLETSRFGHVLCTAAAAGARRDISFATLCQQHFCLMSLMLLNLPRIITVQGRDLT